MITFGCFWKTFDILPYLNIDFEEDIIGKHCDINIGWLFFELTISF